MSDKLTSALLKQVHQETLVPSSTLIGLLTVNAVSKPARMSRREQESYTADVIGLLDYTSYLPQRLPLTSDFMKDVLDPVMTVTVPTGMYRVTMRKLLRLTLIQLQQQAELMKLDPLNLDEEGIASLILINMDDKTPLIPALSHALLSKEIAYVYGIQFQVPLRGADHPSSTVTFRVTPTNMTQSLNLTKNDLLAESENQGISVNRNESKRQLAVRLVVWWTSHPDRLREPFTPPFREFLLERARRHSDVGTY